MGPEISHVTLVGHLGQRSTVTTVSRERFNLERWPIHAWIDHGHATRSPIGDPCKSSPSGSKANGLDLSSSATPGIFFFTF